MKITENSLFCAWDTVKEQNMEITYENGATTTRLVKHVEWDNFPVILLELQKKLLWRGHGTDLVQLTYFIFLGYWLCITSSSLEKDIGSKRR